MLLSGMRSGEAVNLVWEDVDFDAEIIKIQGKEGWSPKADEGTIFMSPELLEFLRNRHGTRSSTYVFPNSRGARYKNNLLRDFKVALKRAGIIDGGVDVHSLRRAFVTQHALLGTKPKLLQHLARHKRFSTTMDVYAKINKEQIQIASKLELYERQFK